MRNKYRVLIILFLVISLPMLVLARAGGGGGGWWWGYSSSSSWTFGSFFTFSIIWIIFTLLVIKNFASKVPALQDWEEPTDESTIRPTEDIAEKIAFVHSKDPHWNEQKFKELVNIGFFKIQNAWCAGDMSSARAFISDGIMRRFTLQLEPYKAKNQHNVLERLSLDRVDILDITTDENYISLKTLINASCVDTLLMQMMDQYLKYITMENSSTGKKSGYGCGRIPYLPRNLRLGCSQINVRTVVQSSRSTPLESATTVERKWQSESSTGSSQRLSSRLASEIIKNCLSGSYLWRRFLISVILFSALIHLTQIA